MMNIAERARAAAPEAAQAWLGRFQTALQGNDAAAAAALFLPDGLWRDVLAFTWTIQTIAGRAAIERNAAQTLARTQPRDFHIPPKRTPPRWVAAPAPNASRRSRVRYRLRPLPTACFALSPDGDGRLRAWTLNTNLHELRGHEEAFKRRARAATRRATSAPRTGSTGWRASAPYADRDPAVLVIGGGQAGLSIAARLGQLGIDTLIVDRHARIGDNWRTRYHSLTLHNEVLRQSPALSAVPADLAGLHPQGQAGELVRGLRREPGAEFLDRHRTRRRPLRRRAQAMDGDPAPIGRHRAHHAPAAFDLRDRRLQHSLHARPARPRRLRRHRRAFRRLQARRGVEGPQGAGARQRHQRPRRRAGACRAGRRSHHHPAQQDARRQPEGGAAASMPSTRKAFRSTIATCWRPRCPIRCCGAPISFRPPRGSKSTKTCSMRSLRAASACWAARTRPASR